MAEVRVLPGVERRDLLPALPAEVLLEKAITAGLTGVVIVGTARDGSLYVAGSYSDADKAVGVLMRGVATIAGSEINNDGVLDTEERQ